MQEIRRCRSRAKLPILLLSAGLICWAACLIWTKPAISGSEAPLPLTEAQQKVAAEFDRLDAALKQAAQKLGTTGLTRDKARPILAELCGCFAYAVDCAAVDPRGDMVTVEPEPFRDFEGKNIGDQEQVKRVMQGRKPVLSDVFLSVEGIPAVDAEYPVTTPEGQLIGSVSFLFRPERFLKDIIRPLVQGTPVDIWAMEKGGLILYDVDTPQVGLDLFTAPLYRPYNELISLGRRIAATPEGAGAYRFTQSSTKKVVKKNAFWRTASLYGTDWRLVAIRVEEEGSGKKAGSVLQGSTPEQGLELFASSPGLTKALAGGDKAKAMKLFRDFYEATPGIYSVQWVDEKGINRFGYPAENSLTDYDYHSNRVPSDRDTLKVLAERKPAGFEVPLIEGKTGAFTFRPLSSQGRYLGMVYFIRLK